MKINWNKIVEIDDVTIWTDGNNYFCSRYWDYENPGFDECDNISYDSKEIIKKIVTLYESKIKSLEYRENKYRIEIDNQMKKWINDKNSNINLTEYFKDIYENLLFISELRKGGK